MSINRDHDAKRHHKGRPLPLPVAERRNDPSQQIPPEKMRSLLVLSLLLSAACAASSFGRQKAAFIVPRGGASTQNATTAPPSDYGRITDDFYRLTPEQIETFRREGCVTIENVLTEEEVDELQAVFDRFTSGEIPVPGKDFCDMSKP